MDRHGTLVTLEGVSRKRGRGGSVEGRGEGGREGVSREEGEGRECRGKRRGGGGGETQERIKCTVNS